MSHYYSEHQSSALHLKRILAFLRGNQLEFFTASGIFSKGEIDKGTELLINYAEIKQPSEILDLGCGYGAVGISIAKSFPECFIYFCDINNRAIVMTKKNIALNRIEHAEAHQGNAFAPFKEKEFDAILLNPPQTAGKQICFQMIEESRLHLKQNGTFQLVARHNKGGATLAKKMMEIFGNVIEIAKKAGYRVYLSKK